MKWSGPAVKRGETIGASGDAQRNPTVQQQDASHIKGLSGDKSGLATKESRSPYGGHCLTLGVGLTPNVTDSIPEVIQHKLSGESEPIRFRSRRLWKPEQHRACLLS